MEAAFINGLLLALTHALGKPYDIGAAELLISKGGQSMGRHSRPGVSRRGKQALATAAAAASEGLFLVTWGNHLSAQDYIYERRAVGILGSLLHRTPGHRPGRSGGRRDREGRSRRAQALPRLEGGPAA